MTTQHFMGILGIGVVAVAATAVIYQLNKRTAVINTVNNLGGSALKNLYK